VQAAAYGLPIVATKNGGPVDIIGVSIFQCLSGGKAPQYWCSIAAACC